MLLILIVVDLAILFTSICIFKTIINPCTVYVLIWLFDVILFCMKGFPYEDLTIFSFFLIVVFEIAICAGMMIGKRCSFVIKRNSRPSNITFLYEDPGAQRIIDRYIVYSSIISSISIIAGLKAVLSSTGSIWGLINSVSQTYQDRTSGNLDYGVTIFSSMIYVALILISFQFSKGHMKVFYIVPLTLSLINALNLGGRNASIYTIICLLIPFALSKNNRNRDTNMSSYNSSSILRNRRRTFISVCTFFSLAGGILLTINAQRSQTSRTFYFYGNITAEWLSNLVNKYTGVLSAYTYFTGPLAYYNNYVQQPYFSFGANTLYFLYRQLAKLGFNIKLMTTLPFENVPISMNVGTYITELMIDFGLMGGLLFAFLFGICVGISHRRSMNNDLIANLFVSMFYICVILSFFMWYLRAPVIWLTIIYGIIIINLLNRDLKKRGYYSRI